MYKVKLSSLKLIIVLMSFFIPLIALGQDQLVFEQLTTSDGLSNGSINAIFKDSRGFMWFCTDDGLNRYDGYNFKIYKSEEPNNIQAQSIRFISIVEDSFSNIWVGTSEGLYYYDYNSDRIIKFSSLKTIDFTNIPIVRDIVSLYADSFHYLWIGTFDRIIRVKISSSDIRAISQKDISIFKISSSTSQNISNNIITSICEDKQHQIWISSNLNQLDCYNYSENIFKHYKIEIPEIRKWDNLNNIIRVDKNDDFWIASRGIGLIYWEREKQKFTNYKTLIKNNDSIDICFIRSLMIDKLGRIWIGTDGNGLVIFDKEKSEISHYVKDSEDQSNLSSNAIYSFYEDSNGIDWVGTYMLGLNKYDPVKLNFGSIYSSPNSETGLSNGLVTSFCEDKNNKIWVSTDGGGLNLFDRKNNQFKKYKHDPSNPESISTNTTMTLFCDHDNDIWIGTYNGGLNRFDQKSQKFHHYWFDPNDSMSISCNHPWDFAQDKMNNIWVATVDAGLNLMKPGMTSFIHYKTSNGRRFIPDQLCSNSITQLFIDKTNFLWIGTEYGLDRVDLNQVDFNLPKPKLIFKHFLSSLTENSISYNRITCMNEDNLGNLWIGTKGGGLNKLNLKTLLFTNYNVNDGLPHNVINGILFDKNNNLWISTNNGLSNFNIKTQKFKNYNSSDGLQSDVFVKTSCLKTSDGMFMFGGINGFNAFYPEKIDFKVSEIYPVLTNFNLFNQSVTAGDKINDRVLLPRPIFDLDEITLYYKENSFAFEFSALDYSNPEKIFYSYQLKGFDKEWQITDSKMRVAKYTNLAPSEYVFCVKASINPEVWPDKGTSIVLIICSPWWKTLWFKIVAFVLAVTFLILFFKVRVYRLEKQKRILKSKVAERTTELREANMTKDKFLSIISHDLINPFNSILGYSDLLLSNYSKWDEETRIEAIGTINDSSNDLFRLLRNLLQWSRSERGLIEYSPQKIDLKKCIHDNISLQIITAKSKNLIIDAISLDENCFVKSDEHILNTIIRNLISNSIKFTPSGGQITIETKCENNNVLISIIDNGVGISKEKLENLFRIDVQQSSMGTNNEKGTGLGLFLVNEFVTKQLGKLYIKSEIGKGSVFSFTVPVWTDEIVI